MKSIICLIFFSLSLFFTQNVQGQSNSYTNELKGFEFFGNGKLKNLQLAVSTVDDVKRLFGKNCKKTCDYDSDWLISFEYYEDIWIKESRNEKDEKLQYRLDSKYLGKLRSILLRPKKQISFTDVSFPGAFQKIQLTSTSMFRSDGRRIAGDEAFQDSSGLTYEILTETIKYNLKNKRARTYNKGELVLIKYDVPKKLEETLFVLKN